MRQPSRKLYFLYHELRSSDSAYSYVLENKVFESHLDCFAQIAAKGDSALEPEITFDDGHISNFEYALPQLQTRGLKAQFFITVGWTGQKSGYMGWDKLRALHAAGQLIGAHGWTHTLLTHCSAKQLQTELSSSRHLLEDKLGTSITTMSLPGGRYNRRVLDACQDAGYTQIYTSIPRSEPLPLGLAIGRLNVRRDMKLDWIADLFDPTGGALPRLGLQYQIKSAAQMVMGDRVYEKLWALLNRQEPETDAAGAVQE
ncbi:MAG TPA: polysaccharide deacetylase family protein [Edaphobacter sp.]|nr:polysaccharide deacetylase family protein [Edaphobacter sp.]